MTDRLHGAIDPRGAGGGRARRWADAAVFGERHVVLRSANHQEDYTVRELDTNGVPGAQGPRCLVFENHQVVRRLWRYPVDWATMPDTALLALAGIDP